MITISKQKFTQLNWLLISVVVLIIASAIYYFQLTILNSILLVTSAPTLVWLVLKAFEPLINKTIKAFEKDKKDTKKYVDLAIRQGKKEFIFGPQKHKVWATNQINASKIFNKKIKPAIEKNPNKRFEYISDAYNNL